jgi:hypothetical protein
MAYPAALDSFTTKVDGAGNTILAAHVNAVQTSIVNTETELGTDPAGTATDVKTRLAVSLADDGDWRLTGSSTLTISGGVITATNNLHKVDTEASASTDILDTINGGADGYMLALSLANSARLVTISHNTGNIYCTNGKSIKLSGDSDIVLLVYSSALSKWRTVYTGVILNASNTYWQDLRIAPTARTTGTNAPTFEKWYDDSGGTSRGVYLYSFDDAAGGSEKEIFFTAELPPNWAGTAVTIHLHWVPSTDDTTATPRWGLEYAWRETGKVFADTTIIYAVGNSESAADLTANHVYQTMFAALTPDADNDGSDSILLCRVFRDSANAADTYDVGGNKCGLVSIDVHYEINSLGSAS